MAFQETYKHIEGTEDLFSEDGMTPPESVADTFDPCSANRPHCSNPRPDFTYMIRDSGSGKFLTYKDGGVTLVNHRNDAMGSALWTCHQREDGWLGFQNHFTERFLGHNIWNNLVCDARAHNGWERFHPSDNGDGTYGLRQEHWGSFQPVGGKLVDGRIGLAKIPGGRAMHFEFFKVESSVVDTFWKCVAIQD